MPTRSRPSFVIALLLGASLALIVVWPQAIGIHRLPVVANAISFRAVLAVGLAALAVACTAVAARRRRWGVAAALALALTAAAVGNGVVLAVRGAGPSPSGGELTVAAWNTYGGSVSPAQIARLVRETGADVVSLPETDGFAAAEVVGILKGDGISMRHDTVWAAEGGASIPTSILISDALGPYTRDTDAGSTPGLPSGVWRPVDGAGPTLVAAHPMPPFPAVLEEWNVGLEWIVDRCDDEGVIVAGDLNATLDHFAGEGVDGGDLGGCRDAAAAAGAAARGTWPARAPALLGAPIDHVLAGSDWSVDGFAVVAGFDDVGSDHRPIVATLSRR